MPVIKVATMPNGLKEKHFTHHWSHYQEHKILSMCPSFHENVFEGDAVDHSYQIGDFFPAP